MILKRQKRNAFLLAVITLSTACVGEVDIAAPEMPIAGQFSNHGNNAPITVSNARWWKAFNDPLLNTLVETGLNQNLDIRKTVARIRQAEGAYATLGYPLSGSARLGEGRISGKSEEEKVVATGFARAEASWRLDLFGQLANEKLVGRENLDAAFEDADIARLTLISDVISEYINLRYHQESIRITLRVNESRMKTLTETRKMVALGDASDISVAQAEALLAFSRASLPELEIAFVLTHNRLRALLGETELAASRGFDRSAPQPFPKSTVVQTGVPADLIRNRPDIKRAERQLASALAAVGAKEAEMYPSMVLTGNITANTDSAGPEINAGFFRLGLDLPIFDRSVRKGRVRAAQGIAEEKRVEWEKQVVTSVEEVRNAIFSLDRHTEAIHHSKIALNAASKVLDLARKGFSSGEGDFLQLQDAERSFLTAENALALDRRNAAIDYVTLNVALGGTYSPYKRKTRKPELDSALSK